MSTRITADNGVEITVGLLAIEVTDPEYTPGIYARLTDAQRVELAAALDPDRGTAGGQWTRGDLWSVTRKAMSEVDPTRKLDTAELDALASYVADKVAGHALSRAERAERERDEALRKKGEAFDRAVRAERERDAAVARADQLRNERDDAVQSCMVVGRERDEALDWAKRAEDARDTAATRAAQLEREVSKVEGRASEWSIKAQQWRERAEAAETRTAPAVTRDDIDRALINVTSNAMNYPTPSQMLGKDTGPLRKKCVDAVCDLFGIEAEQAVDPVEELIDNLADILYGHEMVTDQMRGVLERVVRAGMLFPEQEADHE